MEDDDALFKVNPLPERAHQKRYEVLLKETVNHKMLVYGRSKPDAERIAFEEVKKTRAPSHQSGQIEVVSCVQKAPRPCIQCLGELEEVVHSPFFYQRINDCQFKINSFTVWKCNNCTSCMHNYYKLGPLTELIQSIESEKYKEVTLGLTNDEWTVVAWERRAAWE